MLGEKAVNPAICYNFAIAPLDVELFRPSRRKGWAEIAQRALAPELPSARVVQRVFDMADTDIGYSCKLLCAESEPRVQMLRNS